MKLKNLLVAVALLFGIPTCYAQFGLPSIPGMSGGSSGSAANANEVLKNAGIALSQYLNAEIKIAEAISGYKATQEQKDLIARLSKGDVAKNKDDLNNSFTIGSDLNNVIKQKIESGAKIDASQKKLATEGTIEYLGALLSTKKLVDSIQALAKNPTALGLDSIGPVTTLASNMPKMLSQSISSTSMIIKYMAANGIDTSKMQKDADSLGK